LRRLAIETATEACSVALFDGGGLVAHVHEVVGRGHAERLIPMIATLPERGRADELLVDCGPGSFTGVRVGLAAARAFGLAWSAPVRGYSSLALIAAAAFAKTPDLERLAVAIIGGHGEYFVQLFENRPVLAALTPLASLKPEQAALACAGHALTGSGAGAMRAAGAAGPIVKGEADARHTALLPAAFARMPPSPVYGRAPDARLPT
jgi:tRNA threonylcarbamoyl adenosine modification protein YeaZ